MVRFVNVKLEEDVYLRLRARAAKNGGSIREEASHILEDILQEDPPPPPPVEPTKNLAESIRARFAPLGGVELEIPPRTAIECPHCSPKSPK